MTFVLLASGVGLINGKLYGRRLAIIYAIVALVSVLLSSIINFIFVVFPAFAMANDLPAGEEKIGAIVTGAIFAVLPVCLVVYRHCCSFSCCERPSRTISEFSNSSSSIFGCATILCGGLKC